MLSTPRLVLRPFVFSDLPVLHELWSDPQVAAGAQRRRHVTMSESEQRLAEVAALQTGGELAAFLVVLRELGRAVGFVGLCRIEATLRQCEVAYEVLPDQWGRGLASEALDCVAQHAFMQLGLERLEGHVEPGNVGSIRVLEKSGFRLARAQVAASSLDGVSCENAIYVRLAQDA